MKTTIPTNTLFCFSFLFFVLVEVQNTSVAAGSVAVNVGVVLDYSDMWVGKLGLSCIEMALSDFYSNHSDYKTRLNLNIRDSERDVVGAAAAALDLIKNVQAQAIIGPENSMQANFVIDLGNKSQVPIISFSATSPLLTSIRSPYFFRATQNDSSQVKAISAIVQAHGWRQAVPIYVDNEFGEGIVSYLSESLEEIGTRIPYRSIISPKASDLEIEKELYKLMTMQTRVFVVHMGPDLGLRIFVKAKEIGMMSKGYVWIISDGMTNLWSLKDHFEMDSVQGVLGVRTYVPRSKELENFDVRWRRKFLQDNPNMTNSGMDIFGLWAYDATFALAMAVEKIGTANNFTFEFSTSGRTATRTDLDSFGVSENGPKLIQALSSTKFKGLSGDFGFLNGQLESPVFEIINVNGNDGRGIGFWTSEYGLVKKLDSTNLSRYSTSKDNLGPIIWPGDTYSFPKGWEIPTNGKKLRIGTPVMPKGGFSEFVYVMPIPNTNSSKVTGYCIDVFDAVMDEMPYAVNYELIPFGNADGKMAGSYNELIDQVNLGIYDAVVGDVSIVANRSLYVDFTLPYTESGVVMVVPIKQNSNKNAWVFLKPLTWDLWVTSGCFFVFIGFAIWVLEHRINEDFRGPPSHHIGTSFWFSFSTMVFAHRERVVSNPARFLVVVWCFVVLILTQSYTASLASLLTVQQLQPTVTDVNQLLKRGDYVACNDGSFVEGLVMRLGIKPSKIRQFNTPEELNDLFTNGSVAAAFDEIPYMKIFLSDYCHKYTTVEPTYKTDGFGFVFPRGSPLVADVSRAILNVTEGDKMREIENAWFQKKNNCPDSSNLVSSSSLGIESFWGLFLIAGVDGVISLLIFASEFVYQQRNVLLDTSTPVQNRIMEMTRIYDDRDLTSHTMRRSDLAERSRVESPRAQGTSTEGSPTPQIPSGISYQRDSSFVFSIEPGRPSTSGYEYVRPSTPDCEQGRPSASDHEQVQPSIDNADTSSRASSDVQLLRVDTNNL